MNPMEEEYDPWHLPLLVVFLCNIAILWCFQTSRWINLFNALISTRCFTDKPGDRAGKIPPGKEPHVTIQICTYNEGGVVVETIARACSVDWPRDKLTVQILDDSTDEASMQIVKDSVAIWKSRGVDVTRLTRPTRIGYKAGNLRHCFDAIKSDFVAHFDADHHMERSFLRQAVPFFYDKDGNEKTEIGLVQAPWGYYNMHQNLLTECDAIGLDIHHVFEQTARSAAYQCFGFNGTGGIWRKRAIRDAGGWSWESVTEDVALSYNAYVKGYRFVYVRDIPQLLEVPGNILAHVQQKHRWTKGFLQVLRQSYWGILVSPKISAVVKWEIFCHLTGPLQFPCTGLPIFLYPFLVMHGIDGFWVTLFSLIPSIEPSLTAFITCYAKVSESNGRYRTFMERTARLSLILPFLALKSGTILFETKAIFDGLFSDDATFLTTPKEGVKGNAKTEHATKSANQVARSSSDDIVAWAGVVFGIHRLIFVIYYDIHSSFGNVFDVTVRMFNFVMALSLIFFNAGFLFEKHKDGNFLYPYRRAARAITRTIKWPGFFPAFCTLCVYSYVATSSIIGPLNLPNLATPSSIFDKPQQPRPLRVAARAAPQGVYFLANDKRLDWTLAFLNSFRYFNPTTPLVFVPYNDHYEAVLSYSNKYNFDVYIDSELFKKIDDLSKMFHDGKVEGTYRKLALWNGPFDEFLYLDVDMVLQDSIDFAFPLLKYADVSTSVSGLPGFKQWVWKDTIDDVGILTADQIMYSANTGTILSSKRFATAEELIAKSIAEGVALKSHMILMCTEQPLLNYLFVTSGKRYSSFSKMKHIDHIESAKQEIWAGEDYVQETIDRLRLTRKQPLFLVHYAGSKNSQDKIPMRKFWERWRDLNGVDPLSSDVKTERGVAVSRGGKILDNLISANAVKRAKRARGKVYFCGHGGYPMAMKMFDDFFDDSILNNGWTNGVPRLSAEASISASADDVLFFAGVESPCNVTLDRLYESFPGKILLVNGEPTPVGAVGNNTYTLSWERSSARNTHVPYVSIVLTSMIPEHLQPVVIWKDHPRPRNTGKHFMVYAASNCVPFRDEVAMALSRVGLVYHGACAKSSGSSPNLTQLSTNRLGHAGWSSNYQLYHDFRYCLVLENTFRPGYVTEKILMAFIGGCIPIWYGTTEIFGIFNRDAFLYLDGFDSHAIKDLVQRVEELEHNSHLYEAMFQQPILADGNVTLQKYFSLDDSIGNGLLKHEIRVKMGLEDEYTRTPILRDLNASEILKHFESQPLEYEQIPYLFPEPDVDDFNMAAIYSQAAWQKLRNMMTTRDVTLLVNGGSSMTGAGFVEIQDRCSNKFASLFHNVTVVDRAHGARNSFHSMQCMHSFFPAHADVVLWEFAINDIAWNVQNSEEIRRQEERNQFILYMEQLVRVAKERQQEPPLVILLYLWDSVGSSSGDIRQTVFDAHRHIAQNYDFVVGYVNGASYLRSWRMAHEQTNAIALGDIHHPNHRGHMILAYLLHDLVTNEKRVEKPKARDLLRPSFIWACGDDSKQKLLVKDLLVNRYPVASFTAEMPKNDEMLPGMLSPMDLGNLHMQTRGKTHALRIDRQYCYELPCCGDGDHVRFDVSSYSPIMKGMHFNFSPNNTGAAVFLDGEDVTSKLIIAKSWNCLLSYRPDAISSTSLYSDWVALPEQSNVTEISFCNNDRNCGSNSAPESLPLGLMSFTIYGGTKK